MGAITCFFSAVASDDPKALARALRRRDPEVLDRLIVLYQPHRMAQGEREAQGEFGF